MKAKCIDNQTNFKNRTIRQLEIGEIYDVEIDPQKPFTHFLVKVSQPFFQKRFKIIK